MNILYVLMPSWKQLQSLAIANNATVHMCNTIPFVDGLPTIHVHIHWAHPFSSPSTIIPLPGDFLHDKIMTQHHHLTVKDEIIVMHSSNQIRNITFVNPKMRE